MLHERHDGCSAGAPGRDPLRTGDEATMGSREHPRGSDNRGRDGARTAGDWLDVLCAEPAEEGSHPSVALVVAHPDDEVIGAGAQLPRWRVEAVIHVTDGSPRDLRDAHATGFATREG